MAYERLSAQDAAFLHLERPTAPMHVGSLSLFEGGPFFDVDGGFRIAEARATVAGRLHLVPRFRRRLMTVPLQQGRPVWVDDEHFDPTYHVRLTALPRPGSEDQLKILMGRLQAQVLDRRRPLWELWFVEGLAGDRVAMIQKTHTALVDGINGVDVASVLLDPAPDRPPPVGPAWEPERPPTAARLLADSVVERTTAPVEAARSVRAALRGPRQAVRMVSGAARAVAEVGRRSPQFPFNVPVGPHRRHELVRVDLAQVQAVKRALGGTVNDVVLALVAGGLRHYLLMRGEHVEGTTARALVPLAQEAGDRVAPAFVDLPVGEHDPVARLRAVTKQMMKAVTESDQAIGARALMAAADLAPPTLVALAARLLPFQRTVNLTVANVPGPQTPVYCMGARMLEAFPYVGVLDNAALVVAVVSYDGQLGFGITGDRDAVSDIGVLAEGIDKALAELAARS